MKYLYDDYNKYGSDDGPDYSYIWDLFSNINYVVTESSACSERANWVNNYRIKDANDNWIYSYAQNNFQYYSACSISEQNLVGEINKIISNLEEIAITHLSKGELPRAVSCYNKIIVIIKTSHNSYINNECLIRIRSFFSIVEKHYTSSLRKEIATLEQGEFLKNEDQEPVIAHAAEIEDNPLSYDKIIYNLEKSAIDCLARKNLLGAISFYEKITEIDNVNNYHINQSYLVKVYEYLSIVRQHYINILEQKIATLGQKEQEPVIIEEKTTDLIALQSHINSLEQEIATLKQKKSFEKTGQTPAIIEEEELTDLVDQQPHIDSLQQEIAEVFSSKATSAESQNIQDTTNDNVKDAPEFKSDAEENRVTNIEHPEIQDNTVKELIKNSKKTSSKSKQRKKNKVTNIEHPEIQSDTVKKTSTKKLPPNDSIEGIKKLVHTSKKIYKILNKIEEPDFKNKLLISSDSLKESSTSPLELTNTAIFLDKPLNIGPLSLYDMVSLLFFIVKEATEHLPEIEHLLKDMLHLDQLSDYLNDRLSDQTLITLVHFLSYHMALIPVFGRKGAFYPSIHATLAKSMLIGYKINVIQNNNNLENYYSRVALESGIDWMDYEIMKRAFPDIVEPGLVTPITKIIVKNILLENIFLFKNQQQADHKLSMIAYIAPYIMDCIVVVSLITNFKVVPSIANFKFYEKIPQESNLIKAMYLVKNAFIAFEFIIAADNIFKAIIHNMDEGFITPAINYFGFGSDDINVAGEIKNMETEEL